MFWKASVLEKTGGNKDFPFIVKLKVIPGKPSVLFHKKSKLKENWTEGNKGTPPWDNFIGMYGSWNSLNDRWITNLGSIRVWTTLCDIPRSLSDLLNDWCPSRFDHRGTALLLYLLVHSMQFQPSYPDDEYSINSTVAACARRSTNVLDASRPIS